MAVPVKAEGSSLVVGSAHAMFETTIKSVIQDCMQYDATRDGKKFLINSRIQTTRQPLILFQDWTADIKK